MQTEQIEIPLCKALLPIFVAFAFVGLGVFLVVISVVEACPRIFIAGLANIFFFGFCTVFGCWQLFNTKPGLIINGQGIVFQCGTFLPWSDIEEIKKFEIFSQKFLIPIVANPQEVIDGITNPLIRKMAGMTYRKYGSPYCIAAYSLKINVDDLRNLLVEKMNEYKEIRNFDANHTNFREKR